MRVRKSHRGPADLKRFAQGIRAMRAAGTYHKYVYWHSTYGMRMDWSDTPAVPDPLDRRGVAHRGPAFLPWHREFIWRFEQDLNDALGVTDFGLPYWDWATDRSLGQLKTSRVWEDLGPHSGQVVIEGQPWLRLWAELEIGPTGAYYKPVDGFITVFRQFTDSRIQQIPTRSDISSLIANHSRPYDSAPWNFSSGFGFRNSLERGGHDQIHSLIGGQTGDHASPFTSVNDPTFFLHHAMVDRIWSKWQDARLADGVALNDQYRPRTGEAPEIQQKGQRIDEPMLPWSDYFEMKQWGLEPENVTPRMVLDHRGPRLNYEYGEFGPPRWIRIIERPLRRWTSVHA